ncbi:hypothetical protein [Sphingosinithalassobacter sp. LHW66-3]
MAEENDHVELNTDRARAGATPGMTRYILLFSMILIVALFAALLWVW